jgi:sulfite exporter TauE/SafE
VGNVAAAMDFLTARGVSGNLSWSGTFGAGVWKIRPFLALLHRSAWKGFSEVHIHDPAKPAPIGAENGPFPCPEGNCYAQYIGAVNKLSLRLGAETRLNGEVPA